jgi:hypothetical protein
MAPDPQHLDAEGKPKVRYHGARIHDLRHLTAVMLVNAGRPEASVQPTMRHASAAMTRRHAMQRDRGENAAAVASALLASATRDAPEPARAVRSLAQAHGLSHGETKRAGVGAVQLRR